MSNSRALELLKSDGATLIKLACEAAASRQNVKGDIWNFCLRNGKLLHPHLSSYEAAKKIFRDKGLNHKKEFRRLVNLYWEVN